MRYAFILAFLVSVVLVTTNVSAEDGTKFPVPSDIDLEAPYKIIAEIFEDQLKAATNAEAKSELGMKLLTTSATTNDRFEKFALLKMAQHLALEANDSHLYFHTLDTMAKTFQVDKVKLWSNAIMQQLQGRVGEPAARQLAELDFAASNEPAKRIVAADTWYELAMTLKGPATKIAKDRAALHYRAAIPGLEGLEKLRAQKRLQDCMEASATSQTPTTSASPQNEPEASNKRYGHGRIIAVDCTKGLNTRDAQRLQRGAARAYGVPLEFKNEIDMPFHFIPAGTFVMGSPENEPYRDADEKQQLVKIAKPFYIGMTEVTQLQYWKATGKKPSEFKDKPNNPVEMVNFDDAKAFCEKLSNLDSKRTYRLPTESEWEYACRAGSLEITYGPLDQIACYKSNSNHQPKPVGLFAPNAWGLYDCIGNTWEWVLNEREPGKVQCRGGAWGDCFKDGYLRAAKRLHWGNVGHARGFRVICTVEP